MGIKASFTRLDVQRALQQKLQRVDAAIVSRMTFVGERFVRRAREKGEYKDQTGNLRSSICYIVLKDGFRRAGVVSPQSQQLITELTSKYMDGYVLIVVAGMNYAAAVESRGKDVLTGSSKKAKAELDKAFKELKKNA